MNNTITQNLKIVQERIDKACQLNHRDPDEVRLLLASKTVAPQRIIKAFEEGYTLIAENKIQELRKKFDPLKSYPHENHFIGHLQSNKVKYLTKHQVSCVHSIDRKKVVKKLQNRLEYEDKHIDVLIQINTSGEKSKFGLDPEDALDFTTHTAHFDRLHIKGLMTIGLFSAAKEKVVPCFKRLRKLKEEIHAARIDGVEMKELSMGMSHDLEWAIAEGATIIRVGTDVFGKRAYPDSYYWNEKD